MSITIENICKHYGPKIILDSINIRVENGDCYCLLGKNGAGKSTIINIIADLIKPSDGIVRFDENLVYSVNNIKIKEKLGIQSQLNQLIEELNAIEYLQWICKLYNVEDEEIIPRIKKLLAYFFETDDKLNAPCKTYSTGMKKKLTFCSAVIHKPSYLILDEPFANLDPLSAEKLCTFLVNYRSANNSIFISSHDLLYIGKVATKIGIIDSAKIKYEMEVDSSLSTELLNSILLETINSDHKVDLINITSLEDIF